MYIWISEEVLATVLVLIPVSILGYILYHLITTNDQLRERLTELSYMLQCAQYQTGVAYYTCCSTPPLVGETASWLLDAMKNRVLGHTNQYRVTNVRREEAAQAQVVEDHSEDESESEGRSETSSVESEDVQSETQSEGRSETSSVKSEAVAAQKQPIRMRTRARSKAS